MKTAEEIKKGLECCRCRYEDHMLKSCTSKCPYFHEGSFCINVLHGYTLAYIQQLEEKIPKWISVEERLPENEERVLFFAEEPRLTMDTAFGWWVNTTNRYKITHWMPLPSTEVIE